MGKKKKKKKTRNSAWVTNAEAWKGWTVPNITRVNAEDMFGMKNLLLLTLRLVLHEQNYLKYEYTALSIRR